MIFSRFPRTGDPERVAPLVAELLDAVPDLVYDQFGNYVVQHMLEHGSPQVGVVLLVLFGDFGCFLGAFWVLFGGFWGFWRLFWGFFWGFWGVLDVFWGIFEVLGRWWIVMLEHGSPQVPWQGVFSTFLVVFDAFWWFLMAFLRYFGGFWGIFEVFGG
jgi:hypothetical protein